MRLIPTLYACANCLDARASVRVRSSGSRGERLVRLRKTLSAFWPVVRLMFCKPVWHYDVQRHQSSSALSGSSHTELLQLLLCTRYSHKSAAYVYRQILIINVKNNYCLYSSRTYYTNIYSTYGCRTRRGLIIIHCHKILRTCCRYFAIIQIKMRINIKSYIVIGHLCLCMSSSVSRTLSFNSSDTSVSIGKPKMMIINVKI